VLASRRPAKTMARVPVVTALSGRPTSPKAVHRSAVPGVVVFAVGVACLAWSGEFAGGATALGIVIVFGVLAASVGLIRSETARDLRTLTAAGATSRTRRTITAATTAALGLLGAILGMAAALVAGLAWARSSLSAMLGDLPLGDMLILLLGLPLIAAVAGWLLAGREPPMIARQPIE
jgi:putative ABC transport system permease protein